MKQLILTFAFLLIAATSYAESATKSEALNAKKIAVENKLEAKQNDTLAKIDAKIAKAKAAGKSTENLEKKRAEVLNRISQKENELNKRIDTQKATIKR